VTYNKILTYLSLDLIILLIFNKYEAKKKEVHDGRVEAETSFPILAKWVQDAIQEQRHMGMAMEDPNVDALNCPPSTKALRYQRMKAYGNHFRVNDCNTKGMVSFNCGVASMFGQWQAHNIGDEHALIQYFGVKKDILRLDYGPISTPIIPRNVHGFQMGVM
jgi:hypothetical protein